jgi:hypothetical protein
MKARVSGKIMKITLSVENTIRTIMIGSLLKTS